MSKLDRILDVLNDKEDDYILEWWNEYQRDYYYENELFYMCELNEIFCGLSFSEALNKIDTDNFDLNDDFFYFSSSTGYVCSTSDIYDIVCLDELAEYIENREEDFGDDDLEEILREEEEEEE